MKEESKKNKDAKDDGEKQEASKALETANQAVKALETKSLASLEKDARETKLDVSKMFLDKI